MGKGKLSWSQVVSLPQVKIKSDQQSTYASALSHFGSLGTSPMNSPSVIPKALFKRILDLCPCLFTQVKEKVSPQGVVHLCEVTLGSKIDSKNVYNAFQVQHPRIPTITYKYPPAIHGASGGAIMEALCSEVLTNHKVPHMQTGPKDWPQWDSVSHITLNSGKFTRIKLYGDILVPAAPHNLLITIKSEAARERLILSGNRLDIVGFGFFNEPKEFCSEDRMKLYKRWGFLAIYMPKDTLASINSHLTQKSLMHYALNINGRPLYRSLDDFGDDIFKIAGKLVMDF